MTPRRMIRSLPARPKLRFRRILCPLSVLFLAVIFLVPLHAEDWQKLNPQGYVNDFAGVLNATTVEKLNQLSTEVDQKAKAQIAVVTVKTLDGDTVEDFANRLFQKWGVGYKGTDRGVMLLMATDDHKYWTEVGYGLEPILPDGKVGRFGRSMIPFLRQGDYNHAVLQMVVQIAQVIAQDSHVALDSASNIPVHTAEDQDEGHLTGGEVLFLFVLFLIAAPILFRFLGPLLLYSLFSGGGGGWGGGGFGGGGGGGGFGGFGGGASGGGGAGGSW